MMYHYKVQVDNGPVIDFKCKFSQYNLAVLAAFGKLDCEFPCVITIWAPKLASLYGPYDFKVKNFVDCNGLEYGTPAIISYPDKSAKPTEMRRRVRELAKR